MNAPPWTLAKPTRPGTYQALRRDNITVHLVDIVLDFGLARLDAAGLRDRTIPDGFAWRGPLEHPISLPTSCAEVWRNIDKAFEDYVDNIFESGSAALIRPPKEDSGTAQPTTLEAHPPIDISDASSPRVNARDLHVFLGVGKVFGAWITERIESVGFVEGEDFSVCFPNSESKACGVESRGRGGHNIKDYLLTMDMAKELSMLERNERGKQARRYFIDCEKRLRNQLVAPAIDFSDPLATARLYVQAEEGKRQALAELADTRRTLDTTTDKLEHAVTEKDEQERKAAAMARAVAIEKESKILSGWLKEVSRITGVGPNRGLKILQAYGILCRKKVEGCSNTDEPGITTRFLDKEWLCYKLQPSVGKTITEDKIGDDGEVVIGIDGRPEKVVVDVLDVAGDQVRVNSRTVKITPKGCPLIMDLLSTCDETLLWRLIALVKLPSLNILKGRYTFSEHHNYAHKMFPNSSDTVRRMIRFHKPENNSAPCSAWLYADKTGSKKLQGVGSTLEAAYVSLAKAVSEYKPAE